MDASEAAELAALAKRLRREIEALSDSQVLAGFSAKTPRGTPYVVIANGAPHPADGSPLAMRTTALHMCAATHAEAVKLRDAVGGRTDTYVVWRSWPEFDTAGNLYTWLCFEKLDKAPVSKPGADIVEV